MSKQRNETPVSETKLTDILADYLAPLLTNLTDEASTRNAYALGIMCWNAALVPPGTRETVLREALGSLMATLDILTFDQMYGFMGNMIERKTALFGAYTEFIMHYTLDFQEDGRYYLEVEHTHIDLPTTPAKES